MNDEEILNLFTKSETTGLTTLEVASELGISKPATWEYLTDLFQRDLLEKHNSGPLKSESWSLTEDGLAYLEDN